MAYHREQKANEYSIYGNRSISLQDIRNFYCQPSSVDSYPGSPMFIVTICQEKSYYREQQMDRKIAKIMQG